MLIGLGRGGIEGPPGLRCCSIVVAGIPDFDRAIAWDLAKLVTENGGDMLWFELWGEGGTEAEALLLLVTDFVCSIIH
jgi:hypothetical protein